MTTTQADVDLKEAKIEILQLGIVVLKRKRAVLDKAIREDSAEARKLIQEIKAVSL